jgi:hypothetical protein
MRPVIIDRAIRIITHQSVIKATYLELSEAVVVS